MQFPVLDDVSRRVYDELCSWLPEKIIDCHVHVGLGEFSGPISEQRLKELWMFEAGMYQSWEYLRGTYSALLPRQDVSVLAFGLIHRESDTKLSNDYILEGVRKPENKSWGLFVTRPEWDPSVIEQAMADGFIGIKPYPDLLPQENHEPSIFDFLPHSHLQIVDKLGGIVMLHIGRSGRLADENNIRELLEISDKYPSIKLIVAHIGRAFCLPTAQKGLPFFRDRSNVFFDTAANLNADVFEYAISEIGPERLLFGSDLPITLLRGVREHVGDKYFNFTDGNYSWNLNRKSPEVELEYTYYLYEELKALISAAQRTGIGKAGLEKILYSNCAKLLGDANPA